MNLHVEFAKLQDNATCVVYEDEDYWRVTRNYSDMSDEFITDAMLAQHIAENDSTIITVDSEEYIAVYRENCIERLADAIQRKLTCAYGEDLFDSSTLILINTYDWSFSLINRLEDMKTLPVSAC